MKEEETWRFLQLSERSQGSVSWITAGKWWLGGSDLGSGRTRKQREKGKAWDV